MISLANRRMNDVYTGPHLGVTSLTVNFHLSPVTLAIQDSLLARTNCDKLEEEVESTEKLGPVVRIAARKHCAFVDLKGVVKGLLQQFTSVRKTLRS